MQNKWLFALLLLIGGVAIGLMLDRPAVTPDAPRDNQSSASAAGVRGAGIDPAQISVGIDDLRRELRQEITARRTLQRQLEQLQKQVAELQSELPTGGDIGNETLAGDESNPEPDDQTWFNRQALIDSGMDEVQANELKIFFEQLELDRLYLRDQSSRENWSRQELRDALSAVDDRESDLRNSLSESAYDAYLYASGQTNRVTVASVLESAQAGTAGIRSGDHIIRYDNQRIYNWRDLRTATTAGNVGDSVTLEIERDGQRMEYYLARGPLGVRTNSLSIAP